MRRFLPALLLVCCAPLPALAKNISISMTPIAELSLGTLSVKLAVSNLGDEAGVGKPRMGRKPTWSPIDEHYKAIRQDMLTLTEDLRIAAQTSTTFCRC